MLSDRGLAKLKPREMLYRVADARGLCIEVAPSGSRLWRFRYRYNGAAKMLSLGAYPTVTLAEARGLCDDHRKLLAKGIDPSAHRKAEKMRGAAAAANTFKAAADEWMKRRVGKGGKTVGDITVAKNTWLLDYALPDLGARPIAAITAPEILAVLRKIEAKGKLETAARVRVKMSQVFRYAIQAGLAERDPTADLRGALKAPTVKHRAAVTDPKAIGELLRAIDGYQGSAITAAALKLAPLVFVRPGELRGARWDEFDLDDAVWRIPAERMKMKEPHVVPLAPQAVAILKEIHELTKTSTFVFPSLRAWTRPMSENTINAALRRLGYSKDEATGHGFRSMASTRLNELGWAPDLIERQLAHGEKDAVRAAYNRAQYLPERRKMMAAWADYLDGLKAGADVVPIRKAV